MMKALLVTVVIAGGAAISAMPTPSFAACADYCVNYCTKRGSTGSMMAACQSICSSKCEMSKSSRGKTKK